MFTMCIALFMAMLDNTVVNVALPTLSRKLGAGVSGLQWIVDGYFLAFASLLLTGGIMGDRYGRKKMFLTGLGLFTLSSLLCGLSSSTGQLVASRALQGVGAALLMPGTLSILTVTFPAEERAQAIGIWAGVSGLALALGPTAGGWLVQNVGWQSVFFLNVPIGLIGLIIATRTVKESKAPHARSLDLVGLGLGTGALLTITYGLIEANQKGWSDPLIIGSLGLAVVLFAAFIFFESRNPKAMMPLSFFKVPAFSAGNFTAFAVSLGMFGTWFFMSLYMQLIRGYSPLQAGVRFLPMTLMIVITAPNAGRLAQKKGSRLPMTIGLLLVTTGLGLFSTLGVTTSFGYVIPMLMMTGVGLGMTMTPMTAAVMNAVGPARAGLGSATTNTSREVGGVFGIALLGTILTTKLKSSLTTKLAASGLSAGQRAHVIASAGHGQVTPSLFKGMSLQQVLFVKTSFATSFIDGFHIAVLVGASMLLVAAIVANRFIPSGVHTSEQEAATDEATALTAAGH